MVCRGPFSFGTNFVSAPNPSAEDDGVILSSIFDGIKGVNYLAIIDAKTMKTVSTLYCQDDWAHLMSFGIHGSFFGSTCGV